MKIAVILDKTSTKTKVFHVNTIINHFDPVIIESNIDISRTDKSYSDVIKSLGHELLSILGVEHIEIHRYKISIKLGHCFDWSGGLENAIHDTIRKTVFGKPIMSSKK